MSNETEVRQTPLGPIEKTLYKLQRIEFDDADGDPCFLEQCQSVSCMYIGAEHHSLIHLNQQTVRKLIPVLEQWLLTGSFDDSKTEDKTA